SSSANRNDPLQRIHGLGVSPRPNELTNWETTARRNSSRRSSVTCGRPSAWHVSRAAITASGEQQARSASGPSGSSHRRSVTPIASGPARRSATALSTPPLPMSSRRENLDLPGGCLAGIGGVSAYPDAGSLYVSVGSNVKRETTNRVGHDRV